MADTPTATEMERAINDAFEWRVADTRMRDHAREMHDLLVAARNHILGRDWADNRGLIGEIDALLSRIKMEKADG